MSVLKAWFCACVLVSVAGGSVSAQEALSQSSSNLVTTEMLKLTSDVQIHDEMPGSTKVCFGQKQTRCVTLEQLREWVPAEGAETKLAALERVNLSYRMMLSDLQSKEQACQGQLGPLLFRQNSEAIQQEAAALKAKREQEHPGHDYDVNTGVLTKKPEKK